MYEICIVIMLSAYVKNLTILLLFLRNKEKEKKRKKLVLKYKIRVNLNIFSLNRLTFDSPYSFSFFFFHNKMWLFTFVLTGRSFHTHIWGRKKKKKKKIGVHFKAWIFKISLNNFSFTNVLLFKKLPRYFYLINLMFHF